MACLQAVELNAKRITSLGISLAGGDQLQKQVGQVQHPAMAPCRAAEAGPCASPPLHFFHFWSMQQCLIGDSIPPASISKTQGDYRLGLDWIKARNTRVPEEEEEAQQQQQRRPEE